MNHVLKALVLLSVPCLALAQTKMIIDKTNGISDSLNLSDIKSITFKTSLAIPANGLAAYYPFINGDAKDFSGNGNNGTITGATPTSDRFGIPNSAYLFAGFGQRIVISDGERLNLPQDLTISAWISSTSNNVYQKIVTREKTGYVCYRFVYDGQNTRITFAQGTNAVVVNSPTNSVSPNAWHHVAVTRLGQGTSPDQIKLYVEGILVFSGSLAQPPQDATGQVSSISDTDPTGDGYFNGSLDDIRIYSRALTDAEIQSLYHEGGW